jgi:anti-sigma-K factor RskA
VSGREYGSVPEAQCEHAPDAAAYVLGALPDEEVQAFREHMAACAVCPGEVARLQAVADGLAIGVAPQPVPPELRAGIMASVHAEAELLRAAGHDADRPPAAVPWWRWRLAPALAAATALVAGLLIGALVLNGGSGMTRTQVVQATVLVPGHRATAELRKVGSHVELVVEGLPAPPPGRIYEVWLERGTQAPEPTDVLFSVTHRGDGSVGVSGYERGVSKVLVTDEPLGGSRKPTRTPIIIAPTT